MDVLSASFDDDKIAWYENLDGQGNFSSQQIITLNANGARFVYAGDLDNDGDKDVVSAYGADSFDGNLAWYENIDGQGTFGPQLIISTEVNGIKTVYSRDIDNDGDLDILTAASSSGGKIAWYENLDGLGSFSGELILTSDAFDVRIAYPSDIDGDGDLDVIYGDFLASDGKLFWFENIDGQGHFETSKKITKTANSAKSVFTSDLDGDGDIDVLSASSSDDKIAWYENVDGQGHFNNQHLITTNADGGFSVYSIDLDGDGDNDVLSASYLDDKIAWYENIDGLGNFGDQIIISTDANEALSVYSIDLDGDGDNDVLSASFSDSKIAWYENLDGLGDFSTQNIISIDAIGAYSVYSIDLDGDGDNDVLSASFSDNKIAWYENLDGLGDFGIQQTISTNAMGAKSIFSTDIDGDGDNDVLSASSESDEIAWYENVDGQGTFGSKIIINDWAWGASAVFAIDVDSDGDMDVLAALESNEVVWYENVNGQGTFGSEMIITETVSDVKSVYASDINGDGNIDVLSASSEDDEISWHENLGLLSNEIKGTILFDFNSNGCDINDLLVPNMMVIVDDGVETLASISLNNGFFQLFPGLGAYETSVTVPSYFSSSPNSHNSTFSDYGNSDTIDFCLLATQTVNDLNITLFPTSEARPGFDANYQLLFHNVGTTQLSGSVMLEYDNTKLNFLSTNFPITTQTNNIITFDYSDLNPFETKAIDLEFNVLPPPTVNIDDILNFTATVNPIIGDFTEDDNVFNLNQEVIGSFDPNDIRVLEGDELLITEVNKFLHYIIRFQNTGTASAINVRVENVLDENLDWNTFQLESMSHEGRVEIMNGKDIEFIFDEINLADSTSNEPESHGFIAYKIKLKNNISVGDLISNMADIYFDFNEAVETNTVTTEIIELTSIGQNIGFDFVIYPVPVIDFLYVESQIQIEEIQIYNQLGQLVLNNYNQNQIDISDLKSGIFFCKVINDKGEFGIKKLIKD